MDRISLKGASARRILVVDDEPLVRDAVRMLLEVDGHDVETAAQGAEALALLAKSNYDLVITDYEMPVMKGDQLAVEIKRRLPKQAIAMLTAHGDILRSRGNPLTGVDLIINKPFQLADLRQAIAKLLSA